MLTDASFPTLVARLIRDCHDDNVLAAAQASGIPQSSLWRWTRGLAQVPRIDLLQKFCQHFDLPFRDVWELVSRDVVKTATGKRIPLPDVADRQPGPKPKLAAGRRRR